MPIELTLQELKQKYVGIQLYLQVDAPKKDSTACDGWLAELVKKESLMTPGEIAGIAHTITEQNGSRFWKRTPGLKQPYIFVPTTVEPVRGHVIVKSPSDWTPLFRGTARAYDLQTGQIHQKQHYVQVILGEIPIKDHKAATIQRTLERLEYFLSSPGSAFPKRI